MPWATIANVRGPRGYKGDTGDPLNAAGWKYMKDNFDALDGWDQRAPAKGGEGHLYVVTDRDSQETWMGARRFDGGPTETAMFHLQHRLGVHEHAVPSVLWAVLDSAFRYTELLLDMNGQVPDWVLQRWAARMGSAMGGGMAVGDRIIGPGGLLAPAFPDTKQITIWGSSSAERIGTALAAALSDTGAEFHNEGKGGEPSQMIAARQGAVPAKLTFPSNTIPASGTVTVTVSNVPLDADLKPFSGVVSDVAGTLTCDGSVFTFTRTAAGSAKASPAGSEFIPDVGMASRQHTTMLWSGKNSLSGAGNAPLVIEQTDKQFDFLTPMVKRCLVLGHFVDTGQAKGGTQWTNVNTVNAAHAARYGDLFLDVSAYLCSAQLWVDTGISPTPEDLQAQADGIKPPSISHDAGHMNAAGYTVVSALIRQKLSSLGWY
ncbi:hypothetical protein [Glutamicibacter soli]